jgi:hypothetical protein
MPLLCRLAVSGSAPALHLRLLLPSRSSELVLCGLGSVACGRRSVCLPAALRAPLAGRCRHSCPHVCPATHPPPAGPGHEQQADGSVHQEEPKAVRAQLPPSAACVPPQPQPQPFALRAAGNPTLHVRQELPHACAHASLQFLATLTPCAAWLPILRRAEAVAAFWLGKGMAKADFIHMLAQFPRVRRR